MRTAAISFILGTLFTWGVPFAVADEVPDTQIIFLGEIHDNPDHHRAQARLIADVQPAAIVFEMLTQEQAATLPPPPWPDQDALADVLQWDGSGWPDFAMYYPVFTAGGDAAIFGAAVPRAAARAAMETGVATAFGAQAGRFGLTEPLPADQQVAREALQMAAHCDALPEHLLPAMVDIQRLRDATLAQSALQALAQTGGPVVVITGNGHARKDWGAPSYIAQVAPDVSVTSVGQAETGQSPEGGFDVMLSSDPVARADPCEAFR